MLGNNEHGCSGKRSGREKYIRHEHNYRCCRHEDHPLSEDLEVEMLKVRKEELEVLKKRIEDEIRTIEGNIESSGSR